MFMEKRQIEGIIIKFTSDEVTVIESLTKKEITMPYQKGALFNHLYINDVVRLEIDETGLATNGKRLDHIIKK